MGDTEVESLRNIVNELGAQHADIDEVFGRFDAALRGFGELLHELRESTHRWQDNEAERRRQLEHKVEDLQRQLLLVQADTERVPPSSGPHDDTPPRGTKRRIQ